MTDSAEPQVPETTEAEVTPTQAVEETPAQVVERLQRELAATRKEAAKYRTTAKATESEKQTEVQKLAAEMAAMREELTAAKRSAIAARYNLPDVLAQRLKGETPEDLEDDAKALAALVHLPAPAQAQPAAISPTAPTTPPRLTLEVIQKMTPDQINKNWDAVQAALSGK